jgi:TPR repeat protein
MESKKEDHLKRFAHSINIIRTNETEIRERWIKDEDSWRKLPARAWPAYQPKVEEIPELLITMNKVCPSDPSACLAAKFNVATAFAFNDINSDDALSMYLSLTDQGDPNAMTALGVCYCESYGVDTDLEQGVKWLRKAHQQNFAQATYELASLYYTGNASPVLEENTVTAFELFELAAKNNHTSAMFMVADMMMSNEVKEKDYARAVDLFYRAGDQGHRYARSMLWRLLREEEKIKNDILSDK